MANREHLAMVECGKAEWNEWRQRNPHLIPDLTSAHLDGANLSGYTLQKATLERAYLMGTDLRGTNLRSVDASGADFTGADCWGAFLTGANLMAAHLVNALLSRTDLTHVNLTATRLSNTDFAEAQFSATLLANVDLRGATGLANAKHAGPSIIASSTLARSDGEIPVEFLKGCGLANWEIECCGFYKSGMPSKEIIDVAYRVISARISSPVIFYSCFISYSTADQDFADRLYADLQSKGVRCWFALHDVQGGLKLHEQIDNAIRLHDKLLVILSAHSMASEWVMTEISKARKREVRDGARVLFPQIRFHDIRHTAATLLLIQVVHPRAVMAVLGHSQISLTMNTYSHFIVEEMGGHVAAQMDDILAPESGSCKSEIRSQAPEATGALSRLVQ